MNILLVVVFILGNAFFVATQFALVTARRDQVEPLAESGTRGAKSTLEQLRSLPRMLAGSQLGIAACSLGLGAVAEPAFAHALEPVLHGLHLPGGVVTGLAFGVALVFVSFLHMVIGEMVPKNLALAGPVRAALLLAPLMSLWVRATRPVLFVINGLANIFVRLLGQQPKSELGGPYTAEELVALFDESHEHGTLDAEERKRLRAAALLEQTTVRDVMIPLDRLVTITPDTPVAEIERLAAASEFLRFPVLIEGQLLGYVNAKDVIGVDDEAATRPAPEDLRRPLPTVRSDEPIADIVLRARRGDMQFSRVMEGDRTLGIMALDDILRAVAGTKPPGAAGY